MNEDLRIAIEYHIPTHMKPGLIAYIEKGQQPGDFLRSVLENDLFRSAMRADPINLQSLSNYAMVLLHMPVDSWGDKETVNAWIRGDKDV